jgi:hypothetical protein
MSKEKDLIRNIGAARRVAERCLKMNDQDGYDYEMACADRWEIELADLRDRLFILEQQTEANRLKKNNQ